MKESQAGMGATTDTTIAALATAPGRAGVAVLRVSGAAAAAVLRTLFSAADRTLSQPRLLVWGELRDGPGAKLIDRCLAVYMPGPHSYSGEDIVEFHLHGSSPVVAAALRAIYQQGVQAAAPGEFTQRAFLNGRMDLTQAEALADLINATSERAARSAAEQLAGRLSQAVQLLGEPLRELLAQIEAQIDFIEEDIELLPLAQLPAKVAPVALELQRLLRTYDYGRHLREGFKVLISGPPNAGKSSLLNALLGAPRAIVNAQAGTTRDLIEELAVYDGLPVVFCDSAGLTESSDPVERIGIELARERLDWCDLVLFVVDSSLPETAWRRAAELLPQRELPLWLLYNKIDLVEQPNQIEVPAGFAAAYAVSAQSGAGLSELQQHLVAAAQSGAADGAESSGVLINERQRLCLLAAQAALDRINAAPMLSEEIAALEIRSALDALAELVGATYHEDILGRIFSRFCIGK